MTSPDCQQVIGIAKEAGEILRGYFRQALAVEYKTSKFDPITAADREADDYIRKALGQAFPHDLILSEEHPFRPESYKRRVWMVDPLDGTREFVAGRDNFSVIIGLLQNGRPQLGVVYVPARDVLYFAEKGRGAFRVADGRQTPMHVTKVRTIRSARLLTRNAQGGDVRPVEELIARIPFAKRIPEGSVGTKMSRLAAGEAEVFIQANRKTNKWDTLGGEVILREAGGLVTNYGGQPLDYTQPGVKWDKLFVASNNQAIHKFVLKGLKDYEQYPDM